MHVTQEMKEEVARLARKGLNVEQIAERMNDRPIEEAWDVDVEQVAQILDELASEVKAEAEAKRNQMSSRAFDTSDSKGLARAEAYKTRLNNQYDKVEVVSTGLGWVRITGYNLPKAEAKRPREVWASSVFWADCDPIYTVVGTRRAVVEQKARKLWSEEIVIARDNTADATDDNSFDVRWTQAGRHSLADFVLNKEQQIELRRQGYTVIIA